MINKLSQNKGVLFLLLLLVSACTGADTPPSPADSLLGSIRQELVQGKVVVVYQMSNQGSDTEQYADWSAYLNDFSAHRKEQYRFHASDEVFNRFLTQNGVDTRSDYTVFLKKGSDSYFYNGVIVEPMVYSAVDKVYSSKPLTDMDRAFIPDVLDISVE